MSIYMCHFTEERYKMTGIKPVKTEEQFIKQNESLPRVPFVWTMLAPPRSGKTSMIVNVLERPEFFRDTFQRIIFVSPSFETDATLEPLRKDELILPIFMPDDLTKVGEVIREVVRVIDEETRQDKKRQTLLILDDMLGYLQTGDNMKELVGISSRFRHRRLSMIISIQSLRLVPLVIRQNTTFWTIFKQYDIRAREKLVEEFGNQFENFKEILETATEQPHSFLNVDLSRGVLSTSFNA